MAKNKTLAQSKKGGAKASAEKVTPATAPLANPDQKTILAYKALYQGQGIMALPTWVKFAGISNMTAYRWRKRGILKTKNLCGRQYVSGESIVQLQKLLDSEKFAKTVTSPTRLKKTAA